MSVLTLQAGEPLAIAVCAAIRAGHTDLLRDMLAENSELATARIAAGGGCRDQRTLLHVATDWPGHFPNGPAIVAVLIAAGADVDAPFVGRHAETALHWAASSDDVEVLDVLLDAGADIEAGGGVIADATPLADAVAFGQWEAARRLVERGARPSLWQAAALGLMARVDEIFSVGDPPAAEEVTNAFWCACHGGQLAAARYLLERGADRDWVGHDQLTPIDAARRSGATELAEWLAERGARSAGS